MKAKRARGAALLELNLALVGVLLPMTFGSLQLGLLVRWHHGLAFAASEAVRAGSISNARIPAMTTALAEGLAPLFAGTTQASLEDVAAARVRAMGEVAAFARIERLSPTAEDFRDHGVDADGRRVLPNDALQYRSAAPKRAGGRSLHEANLLRIRVRYCHELVVPLIDRLLPSLLRALDPDPGDLPCYLAGRVPLRVQVTAPMQSEAWP
jgi:hypothetical protein